MDFKEYSGATIEEAITEATIALETTSDNIEYEVVDEGRGGLIGIFSKQAVIRARKKEFDDENCDITEFIGKFLSLMGIEGEPKVETNDEEKTIYVNIEGEDTGDLIGRKGQTLDAMQTLLSLAANKDRKEYYHLKLDTKSYRERRQKTIENLAKNVAAKVKKTRRKVTLEPMNSYERRIFHSYLQTDNLVTTKSEGEEPNRRIVVFYNKTEK